MKDNVVGHPGYHVTKNGEIYSYSRGAWKLRKLQILQVLEEFG